MASYTSGIRVLTAGIIQENERGSGAAQTAPSRGRFLDKRSRQMDRTESRRPWHARAGD